MMPASRNLPFPLVIVSLVLIQGYAPLNITITRTSPVRPLRPRGPLPGITGVPADDYYDVLEDMVTPVFPKISSRGRNQQRCDYDICRENQVPCAELAASTNCLCPGFTSFRVKPETATLKSVYWNGTEVAVQWCAPYSHVESYRVKVGGQERRLFTGSKRSGGVGDIENISKVCVFAVNESGESEESCMMYHPRDNSLPLKAGLIGGALAFLIILSLAVLLWRYKRQRKTEASISMRGTAETP